MAELTDRQIDVALGKGRVEAHEPRALAAHYDAVTRQMIVRLMDGDQLAFFPDIAQGLEQASPEQLSRVEVTPSGGGLHWPLIDADLSVPALAAGVFGSRAHMARLASRGVVPDRPVRSRAMPDRRLG